MPGWGILRAQATFLKGPSGVELQSFGSVEFGEISVEGSQRKVDGFPRCFEHQTIGEPQRRAVAILLECCGHAIGLLNGQISMMQKHVDGRRDFSVANRVRSLLLTFLFASLSANSPFASRWPRSRSRATGTVTLFSRQSCATNSKPLRPNESR
jgi:hypothetical protein